MVSRRNFLATSAVMGGAITAKQALPLPKLLETEQKNPSEPLRFEHEHEAKIISDLRQSQPVTGLSASWEPGKWKYISYETEHIQGYQIAEGEDNPGDAVELSVALDAKGWHAIYLGFCPYWGVSLHIIRVKLTGDEAFEKILNATLGHIELDSEGYEVLWRVADLTGRDLRIQNIPGHHSTISWVKLIPLSPPEITKSTRPGAGRPQDIRISVRHTRMGLRDDRYPYWWMG